mmetsp:Transcript_110203/g.351237  ORF Transcript_110203/g.351237 Transcript_110203/m.351237 type:complete len:218 (-) Transcript_110203:551-1204(-)
MPRRGGRRCRRQQALRQAGRQTASGATTTTASTTVRVSPPLPRQEVAPASPPRRCPTTHSAGCRSRCLLAPETALPRECEARAASRPVAARSPGRLSAAELLPGPGRCQALSRRASQRFRRLCGHPFSPPRRSLCRASVPAVPWACREAWPAHPPDPTRAGVGGRRVPTMRPQPSARRENAKGCSGCFAEPWANHGTRLPRGLGRNPCRSAPSCTEH